MKWSGNTVTFSGRRAAISDFRTGLAREPRAKLKVVDDNS